MSEYQYYDFLAIDRPLTAEEMRALRARSTRAQITPNRFANHYNWGDLKGDPDEWMNEYFDAFLYLANWGTHLLVLRLPDPLLDLDTAQSYCGDEYFTVRQSHGNVILSFRSEDESGEWIEDEEGLLPTLVAIRGELAQGDRRALYLGWLLRVQMEGLDDEDEEPPVPAGLNEPSAALETLAAFLRIDDDLRHIAAQASAPLGASLPGRDEVMVWLAAVSSTDKDALLARLFTESAGIMSAELHQRFKRDRRANELTTDGLRHRTVGELRAAAEAHKTERQRVAAERAAVEEKHRRQAAAAAREKHLKSLTGQEIQLWRQVDDLIGTRQQRRYDEAVTLLLDLRDLAERQGDGDFAVQLAGLRAHHAQKQTLLERLARAGL